jgi:hypothetical protein
MMLCPLNYGGSGDFVVSGANFFFSDSNKIRMKFEDRCVIVLCTCLLPLLCFNWVTETYIVLLHIAKSRK